MRVGAALTTYAACEHYRIARARQARRDGVTRVNQWSNLLQPAADSNPVDMGRCAVRGNPFSHREPVPRPQAGERVGRLRYRRAMPAGEKLGTTPVDRQAVNVGTRPVAASPFGAGTAQRLLVLPGGGGVSVVVGAGESPVQGEGRQRACSARLEGEEVVVE